MSIPVNKEYRLKAKKINDYWLRIASLSMFFHEMKCKIQMLFSKDVMESLKGM